MTRASVEGTIIADFPAAKREKHVEDSVGRRQLFHVLPAEIARNDHPDPFVVGSASCSIPVAERAKQFCEQNVV